MKTNNKIKEVHSLEILIERFLAGETSPAQEKSIYEAFARNSEGSLPDNLEKYRPMFSWYAALPAKKLKIQHRHKQWWKYAAAALIAALLCFGIIMIPAVSLKGDKDILEARYAGSYVIRNGQRITNLDDIMVTILKAEHIADSLENLTDKRIKEADINYEQQILERSISEIQDTTLARQLREDLIGNNNLSKL